VHEELLFLTSFAPVAAAMKLPVDLYVNLPKFEPHPEIAAKLAELLTTKYVELITDGRQNCASIRQQVPKLFKLRASEHEDEEGAACCDMWYLLQVWEERIRRAQTE
jgi:hypothetical protein